MTKSEQNGNRLKINKTCGLTKELNISIIRALEGKEKKGKTEKVLEEVIENVHFLTQVFQLRGRHCWKRHVLVELLSEFHISVFLIKL